MIGDVLEIYHPEDEFRYCTYKPIIYVFESIRFDLNFNMTGWIG